eukprot:CAMPEP_0119119682 /NCGR_PEP_ID=MMETSP1310-20130426/1063_1 /TAXON_ID=464262 /ORGANISM="Genus nov. species nov., Strain RCC2339" /LENGTH=502 /DNA_ID=CAMNT_0007109129 /DNA_START=108 /DNA_END=1616 /DNA_ORIENTATION=+
MAGTRGFLVVVVLMVAVVCAQVPQPHGFYAEIRSDVVERVQAKLNPLVTNTLTEAINTQPEYDGHHFKVTDYSLDSFVLSTPSLVTDDTSPGILYTVTLSSFEIRWNIKITGFVETCEFQVKFTATTPLPLAIPLVLDLSGTTPVFRSQPYWLVGMEGISEDVDCLSFACWGNLVCQLSEGDVKDGSYDSFSEAWIKIPSLVGAALEKEVAKSGLESFPLDVGIILPRPSAQELRVNYQGELVAIETTPATGMVDSPTLALNGRFYVQDLTTGAVTNPPFQPSSSPAQLIAPPGELSVFATDYLFRSLVWATETSGVYDVTLEAADVPPSSPLQLYTDNALMLSIAPGLSSYGHTPMKAVISLSAHANDTQLAITAADGIDSTNNSIATDYYLDDGSGTLLFSLLQELTVELNADLVMEANATSYDLVVSVEKVKITSTTTVVSNVGRINGFLATTYMNTALTMVKIALSEVSIPVPVTTNQCVSPVLTMADGYVVFDCNFS